MDNANSFSGDSNGLRAFVTLTRFLREEGWHPEQVEDRPIYWMSFSGEAGPITCYAQVRVDTEQFLFYAIAPIEVPEAARPAVAEFITRANYALWIGNFEMDYGDGEVRYKSSLDFEGAELTAALIRNTISPAVQMMVCYLPGLVAVIEGKEPAEALAEVEANCGGCG